MLCTNYYVLLLGELETIENPNKIKNIRMTNAKIKQISVDSTELEQKNINGTAAST